MGNISPYSFFCLSRNLFLNLLSPSSLSGIIDNVFGSIWSRCFEAAELTYHWLLHPSNASSTLSNRLGLSTICLLQRDWDIHRKHYCCSFTKSTFTTELRLYEMALKVHEAMWALHTVRIWRSACPWRMWPMRCWNKLSSIVMSIMCSQLLLNWHQ